MLRKCCWVFKATQTSTRKKVQKKRSDLERLDLSKSVIYGFSLHADFYTYHEKAIKTPLYYALNGYTDITKNVIHL